MILKTSPRESWKKCSLGLLSLTNTRMCSGDDRIFNKVGVQLLQPDIADKLFPALRRQRKSDKKRSNLSCVKAHLAKFGINPRKDPDQRPVRPLEALPLPDISGGNLAEHFWLIAREQVQPYLPPLNILLSTVYEAEIPQCWPNAAGWSRQERSKPMSNWERVVYPSDGALVFDVEVLTRINLPLIACAISATHWYFWCSPHLFSADYGRFGPGAVTLNSDDLIPMENDEPTVRSKEARLILGHNVSFDRSYIRQQYDVTSEMSATKFLDTLSLHIACSGFVAGQRQAYRLLNGKKLLNDVPESETASSFDFENPAQIWADALAGQENVEAPALGWMNESSPNNLSDVLALYCPDQPKLSKETRSYFTEECGTVKDALERIQQNYNDVCTYCANDVLATLKIASRLYPLFLDRFPNPVTLAGMLEMGSMILPLNKISWEKYVFRSEQMYKDTRNDLGKLLRRYADKACCYLIKDKYKEDPWFHSFDWTTQVLKLKKTAPKLNKEARKLLAFEGDRIHVQVSEASRDEFDAIAATKTVEDILASSERLTKRLPLRAGYPKWYRELCIKNLEYDDFQTNAEGAQLNDTEAFETGVNSPYHGALLVTVRSNVTPSILRLQWGPYPMYKSKQLGWGFLKPINHGGDDTVVVDGHQSCEIAAVDDESRKSFSGCEDLGSHKVIFTKCTPEVSSKCAQALKRAYGALPPFSEGPYDCSTNQAYQFFKITHPTGKLNANVGNPLAKPFHAHVLGGLLNTKESTLVLPTLIKSARMVSYWENNLDRIMPQCYISYPNEASQWAAIVPRTIVAGTVTRRAVERTWLTACNPTHDLIGSELKSFVQTPEDYCFVGADVDSQEMWIASLLGDSRFGMHGSSACSWMLLKGSKAEGTDLHSHVAKTVGISRDHAKVLNYARIYGAGAAYAARLLRAFNPGLTSAEANAKVDVMYRTTKGIRRSTGIHVNDNFANSLRPWTGGSESEIFNALETIALNPKPCTPVLGARMTRALEPRNVGCDFMTSRINWVVQSSAVDYLHLLLTCMRWLEGRQCTNDRSEQPYPARLSLSIHDEVRYISARKYRYQTAMNLQLANLMTRAMFTYQLMKLVDPDGNEHLSNEVVPPASTCFFSSVEIDACLRKDVDNECVTPSNPLGLQIAYGVGPGETLDVYELAERTQNTSR